MEIGAYFVVSEALTNVAKHAHASKVVVDVDTQNRALRMQVSDDGIGGADPGPRFWHCRIEGPRRGTFTLRSERDAGTLIGVDLPLHEATPSTKQTGKSPLHQALPSPKGPHRCRWHLFRDFRARDLDEIDGALRRELPEVAEVLIDLTLH